MNTTAQDEFEEMSAAIVQHLQEERMLEIERVSAMMARHLKGHSSAVQMGALAHLVSMRIESREDDVMAAFVKAVRGWRNAKS